MHDIDRTQLEFDPASAEFENEGPNEFGEAEWSGENDEAALFGEAEENELAGELLEVSDEAELDQFLGGLLGRAARALGQAFSSPDGQAIGGVLKGVLKKALPLASTALGAAVGGPLGARLASGLTAAAGQALGFEAGTGGETYESGESYERAGYAGEGYEAESYGPPQSPSYGPSFESGDGGYEGARRFVRLASEALAQAAGAPPSADPQRVAHEAAVFAARRYAPGLLAPGGTGGAGIAANPGGRAMDAGQWVRRGNEIVLLGV